MVLSFPSHFSWLSQLLRHSLLFLSTSVLRLWTRLDTYTYTHISNACLRIFWFGCWSYSLFWGILFIRWNVIIYLFFSSQNSLALCWSDFFFFNKPFVDNFQLEKYFIVSVEWSVIPSTDNAFVVAVLCMSGWGGVSGMTYFFCFCRILNFPPSFFTFIATSLRDTIHLSV